MIQPGPGDPRVPKFTEDDFVAEVAARLRQIVIGDITLEEIVIRSRDRKDIAVRQGGRLSMIIEVKRPDRLDTGADEQVADYGRREQCDAVAWTDGTRFFHMDLSTNIVTETHVIRPVLGLYGPTRRGLSTLLRPGYLDNDLLTFPQRQRELYRSPVPKELHIRRSRQNIQVTDFLVDEAVACIITGESDVGKSELSRDLASDPAWNAIRLEGSTLAGGIKRALESEIQLLLGHTHDAAAFLDQVNSLSLSMHGTPLGLVLDGFDDWMTRSHDVADLPHWLHRFQIMNAKVIILTRPSELTRLTRHPLLQQFCSTTITQLAPLSDAEMDDFASRYFAYYHIGGQLRGNARDICRIPAMLSIVAETYAREPSVDPDLTHSGLYDKYKERKIAKLSLRHGIDPMQWAIALDEVASIMQRSDKAALLYSELSRAIGSPSITALVDEGILISVNSEQLQDHYLKFRYGQFRDHILWRKSQSEGLVLPPIVVSSNETPDR